MQTKDEKRKKALQQNARNLVKLEKREKFPECARGHALTKENLVHVMTRPNRIICRTCKNEKQNQWRKGRS